MPLPVLMTNSFPPVKRLQSRVVPPVLLKVVLRTRMDNPQPNVSESWHNFQLFQQLQTSTTFNNLYYQKFFPAFLEKIDFCPLVIEVKGTFQMNTQTHFPFVLSTGEAIPQVLHLLLGPPLQERHGGARATRGEDNKGGEGSSYTRNSSGGV